MSSRKYEFTGDTVKHIGGCTLHRIKALVDIEKAGVKAGQLGGWIESEKNLSHKGSCWVADSAMVYGNASIHGDAVVSKCAEVCDDTEVYDNAKISGFCSIRGTAMVFDSASVFDDAIVCEEARVSGMGTVRENAKVCGKAHVYGYTDVSGDAVVSSINDVCGNMKVSTTSTFTNEEDVNVNITLPSSCFYTFIDELRRQSNMLFGKICTIESLEGKRKAARYAESMSQLADKLSNIK